ncbi:MAG: retinol dehydrogenase-12 [Limisphaerales bacterium]|jgi:retinol dehydrogenase-12
MPDLSNLNIVITGATSGIGKATAQALSKMNAHIILIVRDRQRGENAASELEGSSTIIEADMAITTQVRRAAKEIKTQFSSIYTLINNAGIIGFDIRKETIEGFENTIATNYLGHWLLSTLLSDTIQEEGRIINLTSSTHRFSRLDRNNFMVTDNYHAFRVYGRSKLLMMLFTREAAIRMPHLKINAVDPGTVASGIDRTWGAFARVIYKVGKPFMQSAEKGASTSIMLASTPSLSETGQLFKDRKKTLPSLRSQNKEDAVWLWNTTATLLSATL